MIELEQKGRGKLTVQSGLAGNVQLLQLFRARADLEQTWNRRIESHTQDTGRTEKGSGTNSDKDSMFLEALHLSESMHDDTIHTKVSVTAYFLSLDRSTYDRIYQENETRQ